MSYSFASCSAVLGAAQCCSALFDDDQHFWEGHLNRTRPVFARHCLASILMEHCVGAHKVQEMLAEMFGSFDHPELSSTEQRLANVERCSVKCFIRLTGA